MFISLGSTCAVAYNIKTRISQETYPFNWCKITLSQLVNVLENNFLDFENIEIKYFSELHKHLYSDYGTYVLKNKYNITFAHEVIKDNQEIDIFSESIKRRILRFLMLESPVFIRLETDNKKHNYDKLINILDSYFDTYKVIIISKHKPNNKKIIHYELNDFSSDWRYPNVNWDEIIKKN